MTADSQRPSQTLDQLLAPPSEHLPAAAVPSHILETVALRFLARVIHADGTVDEREVARLVEIAKALELTDEEARRILDDEFTRRSDCKVLASQIPDPASRREIYAMGCMMGLADGSIGETERAVLADFASGAEFPDADSREILDAVLEGARGNR